MWAIPVALWTKVLSGVLIGLLLAVWHKRRQWAIKINKLPGPPSHPIFGHFHLLTQFNGDILKTLRTYAKLYDGGLFRIWFFHKPIVMITNKEYLRAFFTSPALLARSEQYSFFKDAVGDGVFVKSGEQWKNLRKIFLGNFSNTPMETFKNNFLNQSKSLVNELRKKADGAFFPCAKILIYCTADTIFLNAVGEKIPEEDKEQVMEAQELLFRVSFLRIYSPLYHYDLTFNFLPEGRSFNEKSKCLQNFMRKTILKKRAEFLKMKSNGESVPNLYIFRMMEAYGHLSDDFFTQELHTLSTAGLDTVAVTMGFTLNMLGLFPEVQEKVYQEDQQVQRLLAGRELQVDDLNQYVYLERVIKETLRLFPVAPILGRNLEEDTYFGKHLVPKGVPVITLSIHMQHNPEIFPNPLTFDPDRFLPDNKANIPPYVFSPFSAGPRICPGMRYAWTAMRIFLPAIVRQFRVESGYESLEDALDNTAVETTMKDKRANPIKLHTRYSSSES